MIKLNKSMIQLLGVALLFNLLSACGGGSKAPSSGATTTSYIGTQSPGDVWNWTLGPGTFSSANTTLGYSYSGTSTPLASGFQKLVIHDSTNPAVSGDPTPSTAYALEVPGNILLVKFAASGDMIMGVARGTCPASGLAYLAINVPTSTWDVRYDKAYQTVASAAGAGGTYNFSGTNYYLNGTEKLPAMSATGFSCTDGVMSEPGTPAVIGVTPSGAIVGDFGPGAGGLYGIVQPSAAISTATLASRNYRGMLFKRIGGVDTTDTVGAEPGTGADAGRLVSFCYTNVETGARCVATENGLLRLDTATQPNFGLLRFQFSDSAGTHDMVAVANQIAGRHVLYGISVNATNEPYNFILIEQ